MTAGMRPEARSFLAPARRPRARGNAFNATDFILVIGKLVIGDWLATGCTECRLESRRQQSLLFPFNSFYSFNLFNETQLVRPPLNSKSEVTEELLWIRLMAS